MGWLDAAAARGASASVLCRAGRGSPGSAPRSREPAVHYLPGGARQRRWSRRIAASPFGCGSLSRSRRRERGAHRLCGMRKPFHPAKRYIRRRLIPVGDTLATRYLRRFVGPYRLSGCTVGGPWRHPLGSRDRSFRPAPPSRRHATLPLRTWIFRCSSPAPAARCRALAGGCPRCWCAAGASGCCSTAARARSVSCCARWGWRTWSACSSPTSTPTTGWGCRGCSSPSPCATASSR